MRYLAWKYMKQNKQRTVMTILGIGIAVIALTLVVCISTSYRRGMEEEIVRKEGNWHVRMYGVTKEQMEEIKDSRLVRSISCGKNYVDIRVKHPGVFTMDRMQGLAGKIGLKKLPKEQWSTGTGHEVLKYHIEWHDELLELYGVFSMGADGPGAISFTMILLIILLASIFIYNAFAISAAEKMRYLGILGSVGATKRQKASVIGWEGCYAGIAGIPLGMAAGCALARILLSDPQLIGKILGNNDFVLTYVISWNMILFISFYGMIMVGMSCMIPASRAGNASVMDLMIRVYPDKINGQKVTDLKKPHPVIGVEGAIALKNISVNEMQYTICIAMLSITCCMLMCSYYNLAWRREYEQITGIVLGGEKIHMLFQSGAVLLMCAGSFTSIIQKVSSDMRFRRQEYAVYQTLGMTKKGLSKMLAMENSFYGIITMLLGIPFSVFLFIQQNVELSRYGVWVDTSASGAAMNIEKVRFTLGFPHMVVFIEMLLVVLVVLIPTIYGFNQLKGLSVEDI